MIKRRLNLRFNTESLVVFLVAAIYASYSLQLLFLPEVMKYVAYMGRLGLFFCILVGYKYFKYKRISTILVLMSFLLGLGVINGNWVNFVFIDFLNLSIIAILLIKTNELDRLTDRVISVLSNLSMFGAVSAVIYLQSIGFSAAESLKTRLTYDAQGEMLMLKNALAVLRISVFLLPFIWQLKRSQTISVILSVMVFFVISSMMLSRAGMGGVLISVFLTMLIGVYKGKIRMNKKFIGWLVIICSCSTVFFQYFGETTVLLGELAVKRSLGIEFSGGVETVIVEPRDVEAKYFFASLSKSEWIYGRGLGGTNLNPFGKSTERGLAMLHRGENHLILKGGLVFLFIVYGTLIVSAVRLLFLKAPYAAPFCACILLYLFFERGHNQTSYMFSTLFVVLAINYSSISNRRQKRSRREIIH